jgi:ribonuclease HI
MKGLRIEHLIQRGLQLILYIDGASRGNPGRAGAGIRITNREGKRMSEMSQYLGHKTNNEAEYWALLLGLREAKRLGGDSIRIFTDSELIERQVKGLYRVKDLNLKALHKTVIQNLKEFSSFEIESIPREENQEADRLANQAIQRRIAREKGKGESRRGADGRSSSHPIEQDVMRGGKSELRRAGWSVIRTVPEFCKAEFGDKESATEKIPSRRKSG